ALINLLNSGDARPTSTPPRPYERGVGSRPTLVDNVETLAQLALIARYGPQWFRGCGTRDSPGSTLITIGGSVVDPGVYETALGTPVDHLLRGTAAGFTEPVAAILIGGYGGNWLRLSQAAPLPLAHAELRAAGAPLGIAALHALPVAACGLAETARVLNYLAAESAAQCGPCMRGLPAIAADFDLLVRGAADGERVLARLRGRLGVITGRGACAHPDGAVRLAASALRTFGSDLRNHCQGRPCRAAARVILPLPLWRDPHRARQVR
ncbi:MAG: NADH-ubiquinone oxidoreductase-F iron-sulfur binding region domain-containing protein, partial [Sciscionella sp.]